MHLFKVCLDFGQATVTLKNGPVTSILVQGAKATDGYPVRSRYCSAGALSECA